MTIAAILKHKGRHVVSTSPGTLVADVASLLSGNHIGAVLVLGKAGELLGILSERDIVHEIAASGARVLDMRAEDLMTRQVTTAPPSMTVERAMEIMTAGRFRHLPVMEGGSLVGLISIGDVVKRVIGDKTQEVDSLKAYVAGAV